MSHTSALLVLPPDLLGWFARTHVGALERMVLRWCCRRLRAVCSGEARADTERLSPRRCYKMALRYGAVPLLDWLYTVACVPASRERTLRVKPLCCVAARAGHLDALRWLRARAFAFAAHDVSSVAAEHGHVHVLEWLHAQFGAAYVQYASTAAACGAQMHVLDWCEQHALPWNSYASIRAAECGHVHVLDWAHARGLVSLGTAPSVCRAAVERAQFAVLLWVDAHRDALQLSWTAYDLCTSLCTSALQQNHLPIAQWLHARGATLHAHLYHHAACNGNLDAVRWLRAHHVPWNASVCEGAAEGGHMALLEWLHEQDAPWDGHAYIWARGRADVRMCAWLRARGWVPHALLERIDVQFPLPEHSAP